MTAWFVFGTASVLFAFQLGVVAWAIRKGVFKKESQS